MYVGHGSTPAKIGFHPTINHAGFWTKHELSMVHCESFDTRQIYRDTVISYQKVPATYIHTPVQSSTYIHMSIIYIIDENRQIFFWWVDLAKRSQAEPCRTWSHRQPIHRLRVPRKLAPSGANIRLLALVLLSDVLPEPGVTKERRRWRCLAKGYERMEKHTDDHRLALKLVVLHFFRKKDGGHEGSQQFSGSLVSVYKIPTPVQQHC